MSEPRPAGNVAIDGGKLLGAGGATLSGEPIRNYLPALASVAQGNRAQSFRTTMQCRGQRRNGDVFLAAIWFSTYKTLSGPKLAAIIVDLSEDLRDREDLSLNHLLKNTRILMSAMSHEIRNLCGAVSAVGKNLARVEGLAGNQDFEALETLIQGLERIASLELQAAPEDQAIAVDVGAVLDELRVLIEPATPTSTSVPPTLTATLVACSSFKDERSCLAQPGCVWSVTVTTGAGSCANK